MPKFAATIPIWLSFDSLILDTTTKIALTRIVARGIELDRVPDGMRLRTCTQRYMPGAAVLVIPDEILSMQRDAEVSGDLIVRPPCADLDVLHEWACMISEEDPAAFARIPDMDLSAIWEAAGTWCELKGMDDALRPYGREGSKEMPRYLATIPTYAFLNLLLDDATSATITRIIARALARERMPVGMTLQMSTASFVGQGAHAPEVIVAMQRKAENTGEPRTRLHPDDLVIIRQWAFDLKHNDPVAFAKLARMAFVDCWMAALPHWNALVATEEKAEADRLTMIPINLASCPTVHAYDDGWRWVHVAGADALVAEGNAMGHCVGNGHYVSLTSNRAIVSLRDPEGQPHVTVQMSGARLMSAQGRSNSRPIKYSARIDEMERHVGAHLEWEHAMGWGDEAMIAAVSEHRSKRNALIAKTMADNGLNSGVSFDGVPMLQVDLDRLVGLLDDPAVHRSVEAAAAIGTGSMELGGFVVRPAGVLAAYNDLEARRAAMPVRVARFVRQAADREADQGEEMIAAIDIQPGDVFELPEGWEVNLDRTDDDIAAMMTVAMTRIEAAMVDRSLIAPIMDDHYNQGAQPRFVDVAWTEQCASDGSVHGVYAGRGTRGGGVPAWAAHAYDPSAPSPDIGAPATEGGPTP